MINKPEGPIYISDLEALTRLDARQRGISDLTGLGYFVNLQELYLMGNNINEISPLAGLTNLWELYLMGNSISDISALAGLTNLWELGLSGNSISDISALAGLTNLWALYLPGNNISDICPLLENSGFTSTNFKALHFVDLSGNPLSATSINVYIPRLEAERVEVVFYDANRSQPTPLPL